MSAIDMQLRKPLHLALYYALPFVPIVTSIFLLLLFWERRDLEKEQMEHLPALIQRIIVTRAWNAEHGGMYMALQAGVSTA